MFSGEKQNQQDQAIAANSNVNDDSSSCSLSGDDSALLNSLHNDDDGSDVTLNELVDEDEPAAIGLLKQIFPEEAAYTLRQMHLERCSGGGHSSSSSREEMIGSPQQQQVHQEQDHFNNNNSKSTSSERSFHRTRRRRQQSKEVILPDDFLRLPPNVAVRRFIDGRWQYRLVQELGQRATMQHHQRYYGGGAAGVDGDYFTRVIARNKEGGLGMTLIEDNNGLVRVHSLAGIDRREGWETPDGAADSAGPALQAGIQTGDVLIGIEGVAFSESVSPSEDSMVAHAVWMIRSAPDPVVLHLLRQPTCRAPQTPSVPRVVIPLPVLLSSPSLLDTSDLLTEEPLSSADVSIQSDLSCSQATPLFNNKRAGDKNEIHPFVRLLADARLIESSSSEEQVHESRMLHSFEVRTRQWEEMSCFQSQEFYIPLMGVRKALSVRIVNMFKDGDDAAYTLWVYDVDSAQEWYAPVRYLRDFEDLRAATLPLCSSSSVMRTIPFPKTTSRGPLVLFRSPARGEESDLQQESKCRQLEFFLRSLCSMIYKERLHPSMAEIAVLVQSFLGCDERGLHVEPEVPETVGGPSFGANQANNDQAHQARVRKRLKSHIQRYTYRLFLLDTVRRAVDSFVDTFRTRGPRLRDIEALEAKGRDVLKFRAMQDLEQIQTFLDKLQDMILEGCMEDFQLIAERPEFAAIYPLIRGSSKTEAGYWDRLVREAVREQVEIEVYVPLRGIVSRWLVNGWRHEDMEVHFKIKELRKRPQEFFRITKGGKRHDWSTVSAILNEGVGLSTLPCVKLRAIVDAAREIVRIYSESSTDKESTKEKPRTTTESTTSQNGTSAAHLGADDFLPIFIYCVVQAEMERPCALCILLRTLCDRMNTMGEIGYYLSTFEAAITHCQEVDLTEDREEMQSFVSVPLNDDR